MFSLHNLFLEVTSVPLPSAEAAARHLQAAPSCQSLLSGTSLSLAPKCSFCPTWTCAPKKEILHLKRRESLFALLVLTCHTTLTDTLEIPQRLSHAPTASSVPSTGPFFSHSSLQRISVLSVQAFSTPYQNKMTKDVPALCPP